MMETQKDIDHGIMRRIQQDDYTAFEELVNRYKDRLVNVLFRMLNERNEAEDLVQETFLRVYKHRQDYDFTYCLSTWIYTIALNLAKNELRRKKKFKFFSIFDMQAKGMELQDTKPGPQSLKIILDKAIAILPVKYKTAFVLRDVEQLSYEEVAQILEVPLGTVKSRVNRARGILKDELRPKLEERRALSKSTLVPVRTM
jgi:RNA polymerase sigma-70 factor (ECF subfamily)